MSQSGDKSPLTEETQNSDLDPEKCARKLTEKTLENYESRKLEFSNKILNAWEKVSNFLGLHADSSETTCSSIGAARDLEKELTRIYGHYRTICTDYISYLLTTGTEDSIEESKVYSSQADQSRKLVNDFCDRLKVIMKENTHESYSAVSSTSRLGSVITIKQAQLAAAHVRAKFAEREAAMRKKRALLEEEEMVAKAARAGMNADLETDLELLNQ